MKSKKLKLGIIGGGPNSWIGHVHRIASRFDDKYILVAGVFSRNSKKSISFGKSLGIDPQRCYSNYSEMADKENKLKNKIDVVAIMTPPGSHQKIAEKFIDKNIELPKFFNNDGVFRVFTQIIISIFSFAPISPI